MTTLGEKIAARRNQLQQVIDEGRQAAQKWAEQYTDETRTLITTVVNSQIEIALRQAQMYVDDQIATTAKTYVDDQIEKLKTDNDLI